MDVLTGVCKHVESRLSQRAQRCWFQRVWEVRAGCQDVVLGWDGVAELEPNLILRSRFEPTVRYVSSESTMLCFRESYSNSLPISESGKPHPGSARQGVDYHFGLEYNSRVLYEGVPTRVLTLCLEGGVLPLPPTPVGGSQRPVPPAPEREQRS